MNNFDIYFSTRDITNIDNLLLCNINLYNLINNYIIDLLKSMNISTIYDSQIEILFNLPPSIINGKLNALINFDKIKKELNINKNFIENKELSVWFSIIFIPKLIIFLFNILFYNIIIL